MSRTISQNGAAGWLATGQRHHGPTRFRTSTSWKRHSASAERLAEAEEALVLCMFIFIDVLPALLPDSGIVACNSCKGRKLSGTGCHRHPWMSLRLVMRQVDKIVAFCTHNGGSKFFTFHYSLFTYALCPPIWLLRSLAVAPSSKFRPRRMAFLPKRCLMANCTSCIRRSLSSAAFSASC